MSLCDTTKKSSRGICMNFMILQIKASSKTVVYSISINVISLTFIVHFFSSYLIVMWWQLIEKLSDPVFFSRTVDIWHLLLWQAWKVDLNLMGKEGKQRVRGLGFAFNSWKLKCDTSLNWCYIIQPVIQASPDCLPQQGGSGYIIDWDKAFKQRCL